MKTAKFDNTKNRPRAYGSETDDPPDAPTSSHHNEPKINHNGPNLKEKRPKTSKSAAKKIQAAKKTSKDDWTKAKRTFRGLRTVDETPTDSSSSESEEEQDQDSDEDTSKQSPKSNNRFAAFTNDNDDEEEDDEDEEDFLPSDDDDNDTMDYDNNKRDNDNIPPNPRNLLVSSSPNKFTRKKNNNLNHLKSTSNKKAFARGQQVMSEEELDLLNNQNKARNLNLQNEKRKALNDSLNEPKDELKSSKKTKQIQTTLQFSKATRSTLPKICKATSSLLSPEEITQHIKLQNQQKIKHETSNIPQTQAEQEFTDTTSMQAREGFDPDIEDNNPYEKPIQDIDELIHQQNKQISSLSQEINELQSNNKNTPRTTKNTNHADKNITLATPKVEKNPTGNTTNTTDPHHYNNNMAEITNNNNTENTNNTPTPQNPKSLLTTDTTEDPTTPNSQNTTSDDNDVPQNWSWSAAATTEKRNTTNPANKTNPNRDDKNPPIDDVPQNWSSSAADTKETETTTNPKNETNPYRNDSNSPIDDVPQQWSLSTADTIETYTTPNPPTTPNPHHNTHISHTDDNPTNINCPSQDNTINTTNPPTNDSTNLSSLQKASQNPNPHQPPTNTLTRTIDTNKSQPLQNPTENTQQNSNNNNHYKQLPNTNNSRTENQTSEMDTDEQNYNTKEQKERQDNMELEEIATEANTSIRETTTLTGMAAAAITAITKVTDKQRQQFKLQDSYISTGPPPTQDTSSDMDEEDEEYEEEKEHPTNEKENNDNDVQQQRRTNRKERRHDKEEKSKTSAQERLNGRTISNDGTVRTIYRTTIKFGTVKKEHHKIVQPFVHVLRFLEQWCLLDDTAQLTTMRGINRGKVHSTHEIQRITEPAKIKNLIHPFYTKDSTNSLILNATIEITSQRSYWSTQKKLNDIHQYTIPNKINIRMIGINFFQEVAVRMLTETCSSLNQNRDDIRMELEEICKIPSKYPITLHDRHFQYNGGVPGNKYTIHTKGMVISADKEHVDEIKELIDANIQKDTWRRIHIPQTSTAIPCRPTEHVPPIYHERLIKTHNNTIDALESVVIGGFHASAAVQSLRVKNVTTDENGNLCRSRDTPFAMTASMTKQVSKEQDRILHSLARTQKGQIIAIFHKARREEALLYIRHLKKYFLQSFMEEDLADIFADDTPFTIESVPDPRGPGKQPRTRIATTDHSNYLIAMANSRADIPIANVAQITQTKSKPTGAISYSTIAQGNANTGPVGMPRGRNRGQPSLPNSGSPGTGATNNINATMSNMIKQTVKREIADSGIKLCNEDKAGVKQYIDNKLKNLVIPDSNTINNNYESAIKAHLASLDNSQTNILSNGWKSDIETQIEANMAEIEAHADQISKLTTASAVARIQTDHNANTIAQQATTIKQLEEKLHHAISRITSIESRCDTSHSTLNAICSSSQEALRQETIATVKPLSDQLIILSTIAYCNGAAANANNRHIEAFCSSKGSKELPVLKEHAVNADSIQRICNLTPTQDSGQPGGRVESATSSAKHV